MIEQHMEVVELAARASYRLEKLARAASPPARTGRRGGDGHAR